MQAVLVSVIIPTYQSPLTLQSAIMGVLNQTHRNLELIVIDDCSKDNTPEAVSAIKDERIKYIRLPENRGVAAARNAGLRASSGEFLAFCDHDDEWLADKLTEQLRAFEENRLSNIGMVYTNGYLVKQEGKTILLKGFKSSRIAYSDIHRRKNIFPTAIEVPIPLLWMMPRKVVIQTGFFDENMVSWDDVDYFVRVAMAFDVYFLNIPLAVHYEISGQHLGVLTVKQMNDKNLFFNKYKYKITKDKRSMYRFTQKMGRDWLRLGDKQSARKYFFKALRIKPYKIELAGKILKTLF
jgi:glycosyltransferase involved in cell wall biosynthesis